MDIIRAPNIDDMKDVYPLRTTLNITTISLEISNFQCWLSSVVTRAEQLHYKFAYLKQLFKAWKSKCFKEWRSVN